MGVVLIPILGVADAPAAEVEPAGARPDFGAGLDRFVFAPNAFVPSPIIDDMQAEAGLRLLGRIPSLTSPDADVAPLPADAFHVQDAPAMEEAFLF